MNCYEKKKCNRLWTQKGIWIVTERQKPTKQSTKIRGENLKRKQQPAGIYSRRNGLSFKGDGLSVAIDLGDKL